MRRMKKFAGLLLAMVLVVTMSMTAFAANTGSITIENATVGKEYKIYKIFDATVSGTGASAKVAYSIDQYSDDSNIVTNPWYTLVSAGGSPFTLTPQTTDPTIYNVTVADTVTDDEIISWLKGLTEGQINTVTAEQTAIASDTTLAFNDVAYGYYYITSTLGTTVTVDNVTTDITVIDKNQKPGWEPEDPNKPEDDTDPGDKTGQGKFVADTSDDATSDNYQKSNTAAIGDTVYFKINAFVPSYAGPDKVHTYTFVDTLADGFTYNSDATVKLYTINNTTKDEEPVALNSSEYAISVSGQVITIKLFANNIANYPSDAHVSITYTAEVNENAVYDNVNTVTMDWTVVENDNDTPNDPTDDSEVDPEAGEDPGDPGTNDPEVPEEPDNNTTNTYVYGFNLQKYSESVAEANKLTGAKFELHDALTDGNKIPLVKVTDGQYRVASDTERLAGDFKSAVIEAGTAAIFGLDNTTYYLEETVAPAGYNILTAREPVEVTNINADDTIDADANTDGYSDITKAVINKAGTLLPSTGGIGTTIFYIVGGILVIGAVVVLITRKRMDSEE